MEAPNTPFPPEDDRFFAILLRYSAGDLSAYNAACEIQELGLPGFDDPSASEVIIWTRDAGLNLPSPTEAEARAEAQRIIDRLDR